MKLFQLFESNELVSELLWFQRYISKHDLTIQMEIEGGKIVFRVGENLIEWDVVEARRIRTNVITDAKQSYKYALDVIEGRFELGELAISKDAHYSYAYAKNVIKERFELGEPEILTSSFQTYMYACDVIKGPWKLGEPTILKDPDRSYFYARDVIKGRWEFGEPVIARSVHYQSYQNLK